MDKHTPNESTSRGRIRDTAGQDQVMAKPTTAPRRRNLIAIAAGGVALLAAIAWLASGWMGGGRSYDASRIRIAEVKRGDLVRDLSADGRIIAANSPTLYAIAAGTVDLKIVAGDKVAKGQALAVIDSPELRSKLVQEESTLAGMQAEASRALLDAQIMRANARKALDQATVERTAAMRDLERYQRAYDGGAVPHQRRQRSGGAERDEREARRVRGREVGDVPRRAREAAGSGGGACQAGEGREERRNVPGE